MPEWLLSALAAGFATGLVNWGMFKTKLDWLRKDVDSIEQTLVRHIEHGHSRHSDSVQSGEVIHRGI